MYNFAFLYYILSASTAAQKSLICNVSMNTQQTNITISDDTNMYIKYCVCHLVFYILSTEARGRRKNYR